MKHLLYIFTFLALSFSLTAQQPVKPLLTKITATWCPNCGTWGWTAMKDMTDRLHGDKATVMALHFSGDLADDLNKELASNFPAVGQPIFQKNGEDLNFTGSTYTSKLDELESVIASEPDVINAFNILNPSVKQLADGGYEFFIPVEIDASNLEEANYSLGLYYVRDDVIANQSGQSGDVEHFKIVDRSFTDNVYGWSYSQPGVTSLTYTTSESDIFSGDGKQELVAILWKIDGDNRTVVTTDNSEFEVISNTTDLNTIALNARVFQNATNQIEVNLTTNQSSNQSVVSNVYSITGRQLGSQPLTDGVAVFETSILLGNGLYIITLESEGHLKSYKVIVE